MSKKSARISNESFYDGMTLNVVVVEPDGKEVMKTLTLKTLEDEYAILGYTIVKYSTSDKSRFASEGQGAASPYNLYDYLADFILLWNNQTVLDVLRIISRPGRLLILDRNYL